MELISFLYTEGGGSTYSKYPIGDFHEWGFLSYLAPNSGFSTLSTDGGVMRSL